MKTDAMTAKRRIGAHLDSKRHLNTDPRCSVYCEWLTTLQIKHNGVNNLMGGNSNQTTQEECMKYMEPHSFSKTGFSVIFFLCCLQTKAHRTDCFCLTARRKKQPKSRSLWLSTFTKIAQEEWHTEDNQSCFQMETFTHKRGQQQTHTYKHVSLFSEDNGVEVRSWALWYEKKTHGSPWDSFPSEPPSRSLFSRPSQAARGRQTADSGQTQQRTGKTGHTRTLTLTPVQLPWEGGLGPS